MAKATDDTAWSSHTSSVHTMRTWARVLESFEEVPEAFRASFPRQGPDFPYTILIPEEKRAYRQKRNERLVCLSKGELTVWELRRDQIFAKSFSPRDVLFVEQGRILLHSWLTIQCRADALSLSFETVSLQHFEPIIRKIREAIVDLKPGNGRAGVATSDPDAFESLNVRNYKFMNYGRRSVRDGDAVRGTAYQPDRLLKTVKLFGYILFRNFATGKLAILTEQELILIREAQRIKSGDQNLHGGVFTYIPLSRIRDLSFASNAEKSNNILRIEFTDTIHLRVEFAADNPELAAFQTECAKAFVASESPD